MTSTPPPQPTSRSERNREKIYQAAIALIAERGYAATSMQDIADAAGMARASVFNHFPSKLVFLATFFERMTADMLSAARAAEGKSVREQLAALFAATGALAEANKPVMAEIASLAMGHGPLAPVESALDADLNAYFIALVKTGQARGEIKPEIDPVALAALFLGLLTVTAHDWINTGQTSSLEQDLNRRFDLVFLGAEK